MFQVIIIVRIVARAQVESCDEWSQNKCKLHQERVFQSAAKIVAFRRMISTSAKVRYLYYYYTHWFINVRLNHSITNFQINKNKRLDAISSRYRWWQFSAIDEISFTDSSIDIVGLCSTLSILSDTTILLKTGLLYDVIKRLKQTSLVRTGRII